MNIGMLLIATGKYDRFVQPLIDSARKYFMTDQSVTYFLFTDSHKWNAEKDVVVSFQQHQPFPAPTLLRYETFYKNQNLFDEMDYLFYCDVDMLFVAEISDQITSRLVATIHPAFLGGRGTPETRRESLACVHEHEKMTYFAGGFNGGTKEEVIKMSRVLAENIRKDLAQNIIAVWHDESHLNRYLLDNPPSIILSPAYCYPELSHLPFDRKIVALEKDKIELRR